MSDKEKYDIHKGHRERVRKRFLRGGIDVLDDHQVLELLLFYVHKVKDTNPIGHELIAKFKSLEGVFAATYDELCSVKGINEAGATLIMLIGQLRNRLSLGNVQKKVRLDDARDAGEYCMTFFKDLPTERMIVISLNSRKEVIATDIISDGNSNATVVDVRKILETALLRKASGVVLSHNHPGDTTHPSSSDVAVTERIIQVLEGINISVIDHIICNDDSFESMSERGFLD
ncbi:MAG: DNA repair protein RadC [Clostridia bacterium]|nr:DNA repair protein RadC [Clostridia bacterium]